MVIDEATSKRKITGVQRWQLGADVEATIGDHRVELAADQREATLWFDPAPIDLSAVRAQDDPFDGYVSVGWKKLAPATAVLGRRTGTALRFVTVLAAGDTSGFEIEESLDAPNGNLTLSVRTSRVAELLTITPEASAISDI